MQENPSHELTISFTRLYSIFCCAPARSSPKRLVRSRMDHAIRKAETLIEALSYIRQFRNRLIVIKLGGSAMEEPDALKATLQDVISMETFGLLPSYFQGGGMRSAGVLTEKGWNH